LVLGQVVHASQQACDGDVLVECIPMQAATAYAKLLSLFRGGMKKPREPGQRHGQNSAVAQIDPHALP
jgi:hypothetical protein